MNLVAKAVIAFLSALGTWGATALASDGITGAEWFGLCGVVVAGLAVYAIPNQPADGEAGQVNWFGVLMVLLVLALLFALTGHLHLDL